MRRLVVISALLTLAGLALLLPSSTLYSILTTGSTTSSLLNSFGSTDNTSTIESIVGLGLIGVGVVLEVFSLFTDVGAAAPNPYAPVAELTVPIGKTAQAESAPPSSSGFAVASGPKTEKEKSTK